MGKCRANRKVSYFCSVASATDILKGRFSDAHTELAKSGTFYKSGYDKQKSVPSLWAWTAFSLSPDYGLPEPAKRDKETDTLFFCVPTRSNWGSRKTGRVGRKLE